MTPWAYPMGLGPVSVGRANRGEHQRDWLGKSPWLEGPLPPPPMLALRPGNQAWSPSFSDVPLYHLLSHTVYTDPSQLLMATLTVSLTRKPVFWVSRPRKCWGQGT